MKPHASPISRAASTPTIIGAPPETVFAKAHVDSAIIEGNERSISPVITTSVNGIAINANIGVVAANAK